MLSSRDFSFMNSRVFSGEDQTSSRVSCSEIDAIFAFFSAISKITSEGVRLGPQGYEFFLQFRLNDHDYLQILTFIDKIMNTTKHMKENRSPYLV